MAKKPETLIDFTRRWRELAAEQAEHEALLLHVADQVEVEEIWSCWAPRYGEQGQERDEQEPGEEGYEGGEEAS